MTKQLIEKLVGHIIRPDTYEFVERMYKGERYEDIFQELQESNKYPKYVNILCRKDTAEQYLHMYQCHINQKPIPTFVRKNNSSDKKLEEKEKKIDVIKEEIKEERDKYLKLNPNTLFKNKDLSKNSGVYGIFVNKELIYVGKTSNNFGSRAASHRRSMEDTTDSYLYRCLRKAKREGQDIEMIPLIIKEDLKTGLKISDRDIKMMELGLIDLY